MKTSYIRPTTTTVSAEPSTIMAGSTPPKNLIQMDTENSGESNTLIDYGHTGKIDDARSKSNSSSIWD